MAEEQSVSGVLKRFGKAQGVSSSPMVSEPNHFRIPNGWVKTGSSARVSLFSILPIYVRETTAGRHNVSAKKRGRRDPVCSEE